MILTKAVVMVGAAPNDRATRDMTARQAGANTTPAALTSLANRILLAHAVTWLAKNGVREVAVVVPGELAGEARHAIADEHDLAIEIRWLEQQPMEAPFEALAALAGFLEGEPFVLHLADSLARQDLASLVGAGPTGERDAVLVVHEAADGHGDGVVELPARLSRAASALRPLERLGWSFGGALILGAKVAAAAAAARAAPGQEADVIAELVKEQGGELRTSRAADWWRFGSSADALFEGNRFALEGLQPDYDQCSLIDTHIQGSVVIDPSARLESTTVRGPAIIGPEARLRHAYIGPYTSIGRNVAIEGAEIEHSMILPGASISHLGDRLDSSLVGPNAKVFRDFCLPHALRLHVGEGAEVSVA